jgi:FAD/FMN-containing dehydrogenase
VLRYGNARDLCLGVEAVMADGSVLAGVGRLMKDNMGYDLRHLLIGAEGTLAILTAASLRLFPAPGEIATAWIAVPSPAVALDLLRAMRGDLGGTLSAFELIDVTGLEFLAETMPQVPLPPAADGRWRLLVEASEGAGAGLAERFEAALAAALERGLATDALIAQSGAQRDAFWTVRETIPEANRLVGAINSQDLSLPPARIAAFIDEARAAVAAIDPTIRVNCFGHLGDGNLHYNVYPRKGASRAEYEGVRARLKETLHDLAHAMGGSVSAEHGVGRMKTADLVRYVDPARVAAMRAIKRALDPQGILNPGAVLA